MRAKRPLRAERCSRCFSFVWRSCCFKAYFFSAQFFLCPPPSTLFLGFPEFVYGIHLIFFESRVSSPFRSVPSVLRVRGSAPCVRARRSSFSPRRARKAERAFRVRIGRNVWLRMKVEDTQRFCFGVSFFNFHSRAFSGLVFFIVGFSA